MQGGGVIPDVNHVARHCRFSDLVYQDGQFIGVNHLAFQPRQGDIGLSVNWLEYFAGQTSAHNIACIKSVTKLTATNTSRVALISIRALQTAALPIPLHITYEPVAQLPPNYNAAHAEIRPASELADRALRDRLANAVLPQDVLKYVP
jgi:hypothetical protein